MTTTRRTLGTSATLVTALALTGCCAPGGDAPAYTTVAVTTTTTSAAKAIPAEWLWVVSPGAHPVGADLEACLDGRVDGLSLTYAVLEVTPDLIRLAGEDVVALDRGAVPEASMKGFMVLPLYDAAEELRSSCASLAAAGCRPWLQGEGTAPPQDVDLSEAPPMLLAADGRVPAETLVRAMYTLGQARWSRVLLLVDDADPAPVEAASVARTRDEQVTMNVTAEGPGPLPPIDAAAPPQAFVYIGGGSVADAVGAVAQLREAGVECIALSALEVEPGYPSPGDGTPARSVELGPGATVPVLEVFMPVIASSPDPAPERLVTGALCPVAVASLLEEVDVSTMDLGGLGDLLGGIEVEVGAVQGVRTVEGVKGSDL